MANAFELCRLKYPRYYDGEEVRKFVVPIRPDYHRRLFPEISSVADLPLFPSSLFGRTLAVDQKRGRTPGNTIRKVYLCRAMTKKLAQGSVLLFYMSKDLNFAASQSLTTVGVLDQVVEAISTEELVRLTAKRSVFSGEELKAWQASPDTPVKVIDFLLVGHMEPAVSLEDLVAAEIFGRHPPQSISELPAERYNRLKPLFSLDT